MDAEIVTALLFQYLGMKWSISFKDAFRSVVNSRAWKRGKFKYGCARCDTESASQMFTNSVALRGSVDHSASGNLGRKRLDLGPLKPSAEANNATCSS